jgi:Zn-finger nucleic acid-binding protein
LAADREERGEVLSALPGDAAKAAPLMDKVVRYRQCPQCAVVMNRTNFAQVSGVVLDVCKPHGIWFDRNELRRVLEFVASGGLEKSRRRQIDELEEKKRQLASLSRLSAGTYEPQPRFAPGAVDLMDAVSSLIGWLK